MKKIIAIIMSVVMCASLAIVAFAAENSTDTASDMFSNFDISSLLSEDILNNIDISDNTVDLTNVLSELINTINPADIAAQGVESVPKFVESLSGSVADYISLLTGNADLVFTYDPIKILGNLFDLDTESLTTQNAENTTQHPDEMEIGMGDVNGDGVVTAADARLILRRSAKLVTFTMEQDARADVNKDGKVTAADARKVLRVSAKLESFDA